MTNLLSPCKSRLLGNYRFQFSTFFGTYLNTRRASDLILNNGEHITLTTVQLCLLPPEQRRTLDAFAKGVAGGRERIVSRAFRYVPAQGQHTTGVRIESSASYVLRALARQEAVCCVYRQRGYILVVLPVFHLYTVLNQIQEEAQYETIQSCRSHHRGKTK